MNRGYRLRSRNDNRQAALGGHPPPQRHPPRPGRHIPPVRTDGSFPCLRPNPRREGRGVESGQRRTWASRRRPSGARLCWFPAPIATQRLEQGRRARAAGANPGTPAKGALPPWTPSFFGKGEGGGNLAQLSGRGSALLIASNAANRQSGKLAMRQEFRESPKPSRRFVVP